MLGIFVGLIILLWVGWGCPQEEDPTTRQLHRIERQLDELLREEPPRTPQKPRRPRTPRPTPTASDLFQPLPVPERLPTPEVVPEAPPPVCPRCWTWETVERWQEFRTFATGD